MKIYIFAAAFGLTASVSHASMLADMVGNDCSDPEYYADAHYYDVHEDEAAEYLGDRHPIYVDNLGNEYPESVYRVENGAVLIVKYNPHEECYLASWFDGETRLQVRKEE